MVIKISKSKLSWFSRVFKNIFCLWHALIQDLHFKPQPPTRILNPGPPPSPIGGVTPTD